VPTFRSSCSIAAPTFHELRKVTGTRAFAHKSAMSALGEYLVANAAGEMTFLEGKS